MKCRFFVTALTVSAALVLFASSPAAMATGCGLTTPPNVLMGIGGRSADLWAVGVNLVDYGGPLTMHWDGSTWTTVPAPARRIRSELDGVSVLPSGRAWAVGVSYKGEVGSHQLIYRWNGSEWHHRNPAAGFNTDGLLLDVKAFSNRDVWAVGTSRPGGPIEHWDGTAWSFVASPAGSTVASIDGAAPDDIWATSNFVAPAVLHWDGSAWTKISLPGDGSVSQVAVASADDVWATGSSSSGTTSWHWDGSAWTVIPMPSPAPGINAGITGLSAAGGYAWAAGYYNSGGTRFAVMFSWSGTSWKLNTPPGDPSTYFLSGVAGFTPSDVWAVGDTVIVHHC